MMTFPPLISRKKSRPKRSFRMVTILLPIGSKMPVIPGKWNRLPDGRIRARYTLDEYARCLELFEVIRDARAG